MTTRQAIIEVVKQLPESALQEALEELVEISKHYWKIEARRLRKVSEPNKKTKATAKVTKRIER